jgi:hypothetical protein
MWFTLIWVFPESEFNPRKWTPFKTGETKKGLVKGSGNKRPTQERSRGIRMIPGCAHLNVCGERDPKAQVTIAGRSM